MTGCGYHWREITERREGGERCDMRSEGVDRRRRGSWMSEDVALQVEAETKLEL